ncbi:GDP dissociation inhibitor-domain-containing protein [Bisporella sp. PMI_857]|nr:GDP dissociation inhibitor-domain-containing protein [Bisporella sp. PMI_857]
MESLSETNWDVVIEGTGLRQSLLALALSRSKKKILHLDKNEYYGSSDAAFSLQEADEWVEKLATESSTQPFQNASSWKLMAEGEQKLSFSRAYTLTLSPQIIYTKSQLLAQLVSSKIYKQLEFQAVGNWWIYEKPSLDLQGMLSRLPNGREDIFENKSINLRAKRSLMKFLKFVVDFQNQPEIWEAQAENSLPDFLSSQFQLPFNLHTIITALTLSYNTPAETTVRYSLPRIARHLTSIGKFGPGFGAVFPKWGGGAEIAQVACRAGAVGGGVYVLGAGVKSATTVADQPVEVVLSNGEVVKTKHIIRDAASQNLSSIDKFSSSKVVVSKIIAIVSSPLQSLFKSTIEGAPLAAVSVIVFPPGTLTTSVLVQTHPIYLMAHSGETGECPAGQCVLYVTTHRTSSSKALLGAAVAEFLMIAEDRAGKLLYSLSYEHQQNLASGHAYPRMYDSLDLAFDDEMLNDVEEEWKKIMGEVGQGLEFMCFEDRAGINSDNDDNDIGGY